MLVLICAFSQLMKTQLMNLNTDNNWYKMQEHAERLMEQLDDNLQHLTQLNVAIHESIDVIKLQYQKCATSYQLKK